MENIYINKHYEKAFLVEHCKEIKTVIIPRDTSSYDIDGLLLEICTDIENFIIEDRSFMFKDGVLYCSNSSNNTRDILYVTKAVDVLHLDSRIEHVRNIRNIKTIEVSGGNRYFTVSDSLLMNYAKTEVYYAFADADIIVIPEGVDKIHQKAFLDCSKIQRIEFPSSYQFREFYKTPFEPVLLFNENADYPELVFNGDNAIIENGIVINDPYESYNKAVLYMSKSDVCIIPDLLTNTYNFDIIFRNVKEYQVSSGNHGMKSVNGVILDQSGERLLAYPCGRDYFEIPESVKIIDKNAVMHNFNLTEITVPESVEKIDDGAFAYDYNLEKIIFMNPDVEITPGAFLDCKLETIDGVTYAGNKAVYVSQYTTKDIRLREGTTETWDGRNPEEAGRISVGPEKTKKIETLYIPSTLKTIIGWLNSPYKEITVDDDNPFFKSLEGVLFSKDMKKLIRYPERKDGETYEVPEGVEIIADCAFHNCLFLKHVIMPKGIKLIGKHAFSYTELFSLELGELPVEIKELAITPVRYHKYGGKTVDFTTTIFLRYGERKIPLVVGNNWEVNNDEIMLSEFLKTDDDIRQEELFNDMKNTGHKIFMALYLYMKNGNERCKKYISRVKKKIIEEPLYCDLLQDIKDDKDWAFLFTNKKDTSSKTK